MTYPDYKLDSEEKKKWFTDSIEKMYQALKLTDKSDGYVLRNNWPVNENYTENSTKDFDYMTEVNSFNNN